MILVDSSVWIHYFRGNAHLPNVQTLRSFLSTGLIMMNDVIMHEVAPWFLHKRNHSAIDQLKIVEKKPLKIDWEEILMLKKDLISQGFNHIDLADLIIAQQAIQNRFYLLSMDKDFQRIASITSLRVIV